MRFRPPCQPGWGRQSAAFGPFKRQNGLSASLLITNGHHGSETMQPWPTLGRYLAQWVCGTQIDPPLGRFLAWRPKQQRDRVSRRLAAWAGQRQTSRAGMQVEENLALGWFSETAPDTPVGRGHGIAIRSTGATNGEMLPGNGRWRHPLLSGIQNLPLHVVVVLRPQGAILLAASLQGNKILPPIGQLRPLFIEAAGQEPVLWAGVQQAAAGQVGWGVDTRLHALHVARPTQWSAWYTTAHIADRLPRLAAKAEQGCVWWGGQDIVMQRAPAPTGLVHAEVSGTIECGVVFRGEDPQSAFVLKSSPEETLLQHIEKGVITASWSGAGRATQGTASLQVADDGTTIAVFLDGRRVIGPLPVAHYGDACGVGVFRPPSSSVTSFEAHPRQLECPPELAVQSPDLPQGVLCELDVSFDQPAADLSGMQTKLGPWEPTLTGPPLRVTPDGLSLELSQARPARNALAKLIKAGGTRSGYTVAWPDPSLADVTLTVLPPGTSRFQGHSGRAGIVFYQDADNLVIVNTWLDDNYDGTSISSFFRLGGFEEVFDAVWTNVGRRITWGIPYDLRVSFDGDAFVAWVDREPVLHRRLSDVYPTRAPLRINRIGLVSNWEFGQDTGSLVKRIVANSGCSPNNSLIRLAETRLERVGLR